MSTPERHRLVAQLFESYVTAEDEQADDVWAHLRMLLDTPDDMRVIADYARSARRALMDEVQRRKDLVEAIEGGPNPLLPVMMGLGQDCYVVSHGRGSYSRVRAVKLDGEDDEDEQQPPLLFHDEDDGEDHGDEPLLDPEELARRGPCIAALDPSGSIIVDVYWPDLADHRDLFFLVLGGDEGTVEDPDADATPERAAEPPQRIPVNAGEDTDTEEGRAT